MRERGLKRFDFCFLAIIQLSLPLRERGLKQGMGKHQAKKQSRRSPCGSVD